MAFGGGTKPATMVKPLKTVQMSHKGPPLSLPKPTMNRSKAMGSKHGGCCGK
jgi:hypothetical protein